MMNFVATMLLADEDHEIKYMRGLVVKRADYCVRGGKTYVQIDFDDETSLIVEGENLVHILTRTALTEL